MCPGWRCSAEPAKADASPWGPLLPGILLAMFHYDASTAQSFVQARAATRRPATHRASFPFLQAVAVRAMLREAFIQMPHLKTILLTQSEPLTAAVPGLTGHFMPASQAPGSGCHLYECSRGAVVPQLRIRVARVDDHDDLLPLVQQAALR